MMVVGVGLLIVGGLTVWRIATGRKLLAGQREAGLAQPGGRDREVGVARAGGSGRYRAGPWPGLAPAGAGVLLGCALLLAGGQLVSGDDPRAPLPDLPLLAVLGLCPLVLATRLVGAPGVASAVCGAYLLPRALLSLVDPSIAPPPLLLVPALAFDVSAWLRAGDLATLIRVWPRGQSTWRRRGPHRPRSLRAKTTAGMTHSGPDATPGVTQRTYAGGGRRGTVGPRRVGAGRAAVAGAVFGGMLAVMEPPFAVLLGADSAVWSASATNLWLAGCLSTLACAIAGYAITALAVGSRGREP
jgi:hypothetical protein